MFWVAWDASYKDGEEHFNWEESNLPFSIIEWLEALFCILNEILKLRKIDCNKWSWIQSLKSTRFQLEVQVSMWFLIYYRLHMGYSLLDN
jgi:hypothetical protein